MVAMRALIFALVLLGLGGLVWWFGFQDDSSSVTPGGDSGLSTFPGQELSGLGAEAEEVEGLEPPDSNDGRQSAAAKEVPTESEELAEGLGWVRGVVLDGVDGTALGGATVELRRGHRQGFNSLDLARHSDFAVLGKVDTDGEGQFEVRGPEHIALELVVQKDGYAESKTEFVFAGSEYAIRMETGAILQGRITAADGGEPLGGIQVQSMWNRGQGRFEQITDAGGNFRMTGLPGGRHTLVVTPKDRAAPGWENVELVPGRTFEMNFELEAGVTIFGTVTAKDTGLPIAGAEVGEGWVFRKSVRADAQGRYRLPGFGGPGVYDVHVRAAGFGKAQKDFSPLGRSSEEVPTEDTRVDFALEPANGAQGLVTDKNGAPLEGVYCAAIGSAFDRGSQTADYEGVESDADGKFAFASLNPKLRHKLQFRMGGYGVRTYDFPSVESGQPDLGTFVLQPGGAIGGRLVNENGEGISAQEIALEGANSDFSKLNKGKPVDAMGYATERKTKTGAQGYFTFGDVAGGSYVLRTHLGGNQNIKTEQEVELDEGQVLLGVELMQDGGATISGRLIGPDGQGVQGAYVGVLDSNGQPVTWASGRTKADGKFAIFGLKEGQYQLQAQFEYYNKKHP